MGSRGKRVDNSFVRCFFAELQTCRHCSKVTWNQLFDALSRLAATGWKLTTHASAPTRERQVDCLSLLVPRIPSSMTCVLLQIHSYIRTSISGGCQRQLDYRVLQRLVKLDLSIHQDGMTMIDDRRVRIIPSTLVVSTSTRLMPS